MESDLGWQEKLNKQEFKKLLDDENYLENLKNNIIMATKNDQAGGITDKKDINAGSGAFNQGSEQDPNYNKGTKVSDEEKKTGHSPLPGTLTEKEDPKDGNIGKNNAGGTE